MFSIKMNRHLWFKCIRNYMYPVTDELLNERNFIWLLSTVLLQIITTLLLYQVTQQILKKIHVACNENQPCLNICNKNQPYLNHCKYFSVLRK